MQSTCRWGLRLLSEQLINSLLYSSYRNISTDQQWVENGTHCGSAVDERIEHSKLCTYLSRPRYIIQCQNLFPPTFISFRTPVICTGCG
jgi:hypothetical protein